LPSGIQRLAGTGINHQGAASLHRGVFCRPFRLRRDVCSFSILPDLSCVAW
jgi:hypothetical protein